MFSSTIKKKTGVRYSRNFCKSCENERAKENYKKDIEKSREKMRKRYYNNIEWSRRNYQEKKEEILQKSKIYRQTLRGRSNALLNGTKNRALKNNLEFNLTVEYIENSLKNGKCAKTGINFVLSYPENGETRHKYSPSIDRKDRTKGYTVDNTQIVVWCYNTGKGEMSDGDFIDFCKIVAQFNE